MLKYLTHKLRTHSINEDNNENEKIESHDSGTESDGDLDPQDDLNESISLRHSTTSPTDTACSSDSPVFVSNATTNSLLYDQHSSEEELEVIYGQSNHSNELFSEEISKRSSSTIVENRKRSLPHRSDDEVRNLLEHVPAPVVNFRTSPPLEALKPNRSHVLQHRSTTPLILTNGPRGVESIRISCDHAAISMDVRTFSPPTKLFHCAVSPRRRPLRHAAPRLQRPHRPCLDFDKMQQLKTRSVTTWRHNNEHAGELSVFCW